MDHRHTSRPSVGIISIERGLITPREPLRGNRVSADGSFLSGSFLTSFGIAVIPACTDESDSVVVERERQHRVGDANEKDRGAVRLRGCDRYPEDWAIEMVTSKPTVLQSNDQALAHRLAERIAVSNQSVPSVRACRAIERRRGRRVAETKTIPWRHPEFVVLDHRKLREMRANTRLETSEYARGAYQLKGQAAGQ